MLQLRDKRGRFVSTPVPAWLDSFESAAQAPYHEVKVELVELPIRNQYYLAWAIATVIGMSGMLLIGIYQF